MASHLNKDSWTLMQSSYFFIAYLFILFFTVKYTSTITINWSFYFRWKQKLGSDMTWHRACWSPDIITATLKALWWEIKIRRIRVVWKSFIDCWSSSILCFKYTEQDLLTTHSHIGKVVVTAWLKVFCNYFQYVPKQAKTTMQYVTSYLVKTKRPKFQIRNYFLQEKSKFMRAHTLTSQISKANIILFHELLRANQVR